MKLEVDVIPVSDVDRSKGFYERLGWRLDDDVAPLDGLRIVQFTPPGSATSITFGLGLTTAAPGSAEAGLVVSEIEAAHAELVGRGIEVSEIWHGPPFPVEARQPGPGPRAHELRVVLLLRRSRWQYMAGPGGHDSAPRPHERHGDGLRIELGARGRASARRGRSPRAREARRAVAPRRSARRNRRLARLVRGLHGRRAGRERPANVTVRRPSASGGATPSRQRGGNAPPREPAIRQ